MDKGLNEGMAVLLVTVVLTGDAMFQTPLGWLADRVGIRRVHLACAVVFSLSLLALPLMLGSRIQLMAICLLLGAAAGALYTLSLVRAGKTFSGQKLIMINALFGFFWSAGSVAGPVVSGMLIGITGYDGLIVTLVASGVLFLLIQCLCKNEKTLLASEQEDDMDERRSPRGSPDGLAWRQPFLWPLPEGILFLLAHCYNHCRPPAERKFHGKHDVTSWQIDRSYPAGCRRL
jgi:MFS family permease